MAETSLDDDRAITLGYDLRELGIVSGLQTDGNLNGDDVDLCQNDILQQALHESSDIERVHDNYDSMDGAIQALSEATKGIEGKQDNVNDLNNLQEYADSGHPDLSTSIPFYSMESNEHNTMNEAEPLSTTDIPQETELAKLLNSQFQKACNPNLQSNNRFEDTQSTQITSEVASFISAPINSSATLTNIGTTDTGDLTFELCPHPESSSQPFPCSLEQNDSENPSDTAKSATNDDNPPLGSSQNPIQIIQQGSTYHSTQTLTPEQLQQIAHVLQQQQHSDNVQENGILYNSATNTRIVYRVVYPPQQIKDGEELEPDDSKMREDKKSSASRNRGRPRRSTWSKKEEDYPFVEGPDLSKEEKEEKKKHRPRTRSGRISKPPSYMIKDYKRIHHLDFNEEPHDASDGGYSDFRQSDEESSRRPITPTLPPGVSTIKARNYKCQTCEKAYIGRGGLARHLRLHIDHGTMPEGEDDYDVSDENSNGSAISFSSSFPLTQEAEKGEPIKSTTNATPMAQMTITSNKPARNAESNRNYTNQQLAYFSRRRAKLKELLRPYHDEELTDSVLPRLAQVVTLWEFLLKKSEKGDPPLPHVPDILRHFEQLLKHLQKLAKDCLVLSNLNGSAPPTELPNPDSASLTATSEENKIYVEITSDNVAQVLGLSTGLYEVQQNKLLGELPPVGRRKRRPNVTKRVHHINSDTNGKRFCVDRILQGPANMSDSIGMSDSIDLTIPDPILGNSASDDNHLDLNQLIPDDIRDDLSNSTMEDQKSDGILDSTHSAVNSAFGSLRKSDSVLATEVNSIPCLEGSSSHTNPLDSSLLFNSLSTGISSVKSNTISLTTNPSLPNTNISKESVLGSFEGALKKEPKELLDRFSVKNSKISDQEKPLLMNNTHSKGQITVLDELTNSAREIQSILDINSKTCKPEQKLPKIISVSEALELVSDEKDCAKGEIISISGLSDMTLSAEDSQAFQQGGSKVINEQSNDALIRDMCSGETVQLVAQDILKAVTENSGQDPRTIGDVIGANFCNETNEATVVRLVVPGSSTLDSLTTEHLDLTEVGNSLSTANFLPGSIIVLQNPDGTTTLQMSGNQDLPMETIQALLGMDQSISLDTQLKGIESQDMLLDQINQ